MSTQKLIGPAALVGALIAASLGGQAHAADELVVYGTAPQPVVSRVQQVSRANVEEYLRTFKSELRESIEADLKRALAPKIAVANVAVPTRG